jgi:hypothetical protein
VPDAKRLVPLASTLIDLNGEDSAMPPPDSSLVTRYVLENPWPLGLSLLAIAVWLGWTGLREGLMPRLRAAAILGGIGSAVLALGALITTAGERAKSVTRQLVDTVVNQGAGAAAPFFADDAVLVVGSPSNPGIGGGVIQSQLIPAASRYHIDSNTVTSLKGYTESSGSGVAHLASLTSVQGFTTASRWVLHVQEQADGQWKITRLTCVSINNQTPSTELLLR